MIYSTERIAVYNSVCLESSKATTKAYSTSFSLCIRALGSDIRNDIYSIYGLVRFADEIVDSFHGYDQVRLFEKFKQDTFDALEDRISTNPVIQSFQRVYWKYNLQCEHVTRFFGSMETDLKRTQYDRAGFESYVVGSAEVVGLMCLKVFVRGDEEEFESLKPAAMRLGAAFQKTNFLRDLREDILDLGRVYFPYMNPGKFDDAVKQRLEEEIEADFDAAYHGMMQLPRDARFGVQLAYSYYRRLLNRIRRTSSNSILQSRVHVPNLEKALLMAATYTQHCLRLN